MHKTANMLDKLPKHSQVDAPLDMGSDTRALAKEAFERFCATWEAKYPKAAGAAYAIGAKHKYDTKSDRWYVILDSIETDNPIDGLSPLVWPWVEDENDAQASKEITKMFNSSQEVLTVGKVARSGRKKS